MSRVKKSSQLQWERAPRSSCRPRKRRGQGWKGLQEGIESPPAPGEHQRYPEHFQQTSRHLLILILNSSSGGAATISPSNLFWCFTVFMVKKFSLRPIQTSFAAVKALSILSSPEREARWRKRDVCLLVGSFSLFALFPVEGRRVYFLKERLSPAAYQAGKASFCFLKVKHKGYIKARETSKEKQGLLFVGSASYHG